MAIATNGTAQKATSVLKQNWQSVSPENLLYNFSLLNEPYVVLDNPTSLSAGVSWDDPTLPVALPFSFQINGQTIDQLMIEGLGGTLMGGYLNNPNQFEVLAPFDADIIDRGYDANQALSPISLKIEGAVGSRIAKIEWKEVGSYGEYDLMGGTLTNHISFQTWLYEGTNVVEYRYGPNTITNAPLFYEGEPGAYIGMGTFGATGITANLLSGPASNPTLVITEQSVNGTPANGTVYRFVPAGGTGSSVAEQQLNSLLRAFPNPATDMLQLQLQQHQSSALIQLHDLSGRVVKSVKMTEMQQAVDISDLAASMYHLRLEGLPGRDRKSVV